MLAQQPKSIRLRYFDEIAGVELKAINERRAVNKRPPLKPLDPPPPRTEPSRHRPSALVQPESAKELIEGGDVRLGGSNAPDLARIRPLPRPCDATGLALSGGGIRSAAFCLGALQALNRHRMIESVDYLSTVSGGGYIGASMTAAMSTTEGMFPFGDSEKVQDTPAVGHLRNYSNYLLPRSQSNIKNMIDAILIILRGLIANAAVVVTGLLAFALLTRLLFATRNDLKQGSFAVRLLYEGVSLLGADPEHWPRATVFYLTFVMAGALALSLFFWALHKSLAEVQSADTGSLPLRIARWVFIALMAVVFLDLLPLLIEGLASIYEKLDSPFFNSSLVVLATIGVVVSLLASNLGSFLNTSRHSTSLSTLAARGITHVTLVIAAIALPVLLLAAYLYLSAWSIGEMPTALNALNPLLYGVERWEVLLFLFSAGLLVILAYKKIATSPSYFLICFASLAVPIFLWKDVILESEVADPVILWKIYLALFVPLLAFCLALKPNAYSLHQFYQDRLSRAFIFNPKPNKTGTLDPLDKFKLSDIKPSHTPYHIINAALNIQGSEEANKRGRDADFFVFTRDFVGSNLTLYAPTREPPPSEEVPGKEAAKNFSLGSAVTSGAYPCQAEPADEIALEEIDKNLNLGCAMAVSGAAVSSNMGAKTVRLLSPTLALLNIRLGYWMCNPRHLAATQGKRAILNRWHDQILLKFFLLLEMLNLLDEKSRNMLLTDGGHIENLGIYELLKRGCQLIIAIDAEADPSMSFASFVKMERYARIDLGIRISLPWEKIARTTKHVNNDLGQNSTSDSSLLRRKGPHCAVGRIFYDTGAEGILVYVKSSLSGDEKDYILDYKKRYSKFPHESTSDQFFTEEQFEVYRALGFHAVEGFFSGEHEFSWSAAGAAPWKTHEDAMAAVRAIIPMASSQREPEPASRNHDPPSINGRTEASG
jgi:hypothetical protein